MAVAVALEATPNLNAWMQQEDNLDIAIIGMAGKFPGAPDVDSFWQNLVAGKESITFFEDDALREAGVSETLITQSNYVKAAPILDDVGAFDEAFFGYAAREARMMDPQHRLFLQTAWHALEHAGYHPEGIEGPVGVFGGSAMNTYLLFTGLLPRFVDEYLPTLIGSDKDFLTTRVSYKLNLKGPSVSVQTACSSSLVAVHMACQSLLNGECDVALAGGVSVRVPHIAGHIYHEGSVFTPDGHCRPFDARAQGTIFGSGVGMVTLKRFEDAEADGDTIYAVIKGSAINNDGSSKADYTAPSIQSQADVITEALAVSGMEADSISYIEAHGTGTYLGDPIEIAALTRAFRGDTDRNGFCRIGSVKSNIGHLDAAAGMAGLIKTTLALKHQKIPATINFEKPNPQIDFDRSPFVVNDGLTPWDGAQGPRRAGVTALGIGGTNAHVVLEEAPAQDKPRTKGKRLLVFSARSPEALKRTTDNAAAYFTQNPELDLQDTSFTLLNGRKRFEHRYLAVVEDLADGGQVLAKSDGERSYTLQNAPQRQSVIWMFSGQGAQYLQMGQGLYQHEPVFREWVDRQVTYLQPLIGVDLRNIIYPADSTADAAETLNQTQIAQPALFAIEYAMAKVWEAWGLQPAAVIGHSIGEYVAATVAGIFSWEEALKLVSERGRLMQTMPAGAMLAVQLDADNVQSYLDENVALAAANGPGLSVLSGPHDAITAVKEKLEENGVSCRGIHISHAFHSSMMAPILDEFARCFDDVTCNAPVIPIVSNLTGTWLTEAEAKDPSYWTQHLRGTVKFEAGVTMLLQTPGRLLLELGPGNTLSTFVRRNKQFSDDHTVLASIRHPKEQADDQTRLLETAGFLWAHGVELEWSNLFTGMQPRRVGLPGYPFERTHHWFTPKAGKKSSIELPQSRTGQASKSVKLVESRKRPEDWYYLPSWKRGALLASEARPSATALLPEHPVFLIFGLERTLDQQFVDRVHAKGGQAVVVCPGADFSVVDDQKLLINPSNAADYERLVDYLKETNRMPRYVANFWNAGELQIQMWSGQTGLTQVQSLAFFSQFYLAKALLPELGNNYHVRSGMIASGLFDVTGEEALEPARALLLGPSMVIPKELRGFESFVVDTTGIDTVDADLVCDAIMGEFVRKQPTQAIAYRGLHRWTRDFASTSLNASEDSLAAEKQSIIEEAGVYLITGGLGGIGLAIAQSMADVANVKLVLVGRSRLPERNSWQAWINEQGEDDNTSQKIQAIQAMERKGSEVIPFAADISDATAVIDLVKEVVHRFGNIHGVVHAAGVIEDTTIHGKETASVERVLAAKVKGAVYLGEALIPLTPSFFVLCSSINAHVAPASQMDYVAANQFLDHFAIQYARDTGIPTHAINWPGWTETGMLAALKKGVAGSALWLQTAMHRGINTADGIRAFYEIIRSGNANTIVSPVDFPYQEQTVQQVQTTHAASPSTNGVVTNGAAKPEALSKDSLEVKLQEIWADVLEIDQVGVHDNFFSLGGNSLMAITLYAEIERQMGKLEQPLSALLEAPTIAKFAQVMGGNHTRQRNGSLVTIREGEGVPVFCMHGAGGNVLIYQQLATELGEGFPVYGFQASGLDGTQPILTDIKAMASRYIDDMLDVAPDGPYFIIGYCMGGTIAWEIGQQLQARGITDVTLFLLETYNWRNMPIDSMAANLRYFSEKVYFHARNFVMLNGDGRRKFWREKTNVLKRRSRKWKGSLVNRFNSNGSQTKRKAGFDEELLARIWKTNDDAALVYNPMPYSGRVIHIKPQAEYDRHLGVGMGWESLTTHLESITLPVYPAGMLVAPFVTQLAAIIKERITVQDTSDV